MAQGILKDYFSCTIILIIDHNIQSHERNGHFHDASLNFTSETIKLETSIEPTVEQVILVLLPAPVANDKITCADEPISSDVMGGIFAIDQCNAYETPA